MSGTTYIKQKASIWTPFVLLLLIVTATFTNPLYADTCRANKFHETARVDRVFDGDTIRLDDGRKLRLIGINTPERGRNNKQDEPFYQQAKDQLRQLIRKNQNTIKIIFGKDKQDRHNRLLAHIFSVNNENITTTLLKKGLGFAIAIPPNIQLLSCYLDAEREAKRQLRGIWSHPYSKPIPVDLLKNSARGFHRVSGVVKRIGESRSSFWLNLETNSDNKFALRIMKKHLSHFKDFHPQSLINRKLIAQGWIYQAKKEQRITIHHPASMQILSTD